MNREVNDLVLVFSSAIVGAIIAFLAALVTFTFYHEIREILLLRGLIVPNNEPRPTNPAAARNLRALVRRRTSSVTTSFSLPPTETYQEYAWSDYRPTRTTRTGTYGLTRSPSPSPPRGTGTPGHYHQTEDPVDYQPTGRYGLLTPSTSSTGTNQWPWSSSLSTHHRNTPAAPRLGRAPWPKLTHVLEGQTRTLSPPPVKLSVYHPLQTTIPT